MHYVLDPIKKTLSLLDGRTFKVNCEVMAARYHRKEGDRAWVQVGKAKIYSTRNGDKYVGVIPAKLVEML